MKLKNLATGEIEFMRYDPAIAAVDAGTHEHVNDESENDGEATPRPGVAKVEPVRAAPDGDLDGMTKDELLAEAERRKVTVSSSATKADIVTALKA